MARRFSDQIFFAHLRNVKHEANGSFYEATVLDGSTDMLGVLAALLQAEADAPNRSIPMRPDHGHLLAFEQAQQATPAIPTSAASKDWLN